MRIVHSDTGKFHQIRRISFYSIEHDEFNPAPTTGNILLKDASGPLPPGNYLLPDLGGIRIFIRLATDTNEFAVPLTKAAYQETHAITSPPGAGSNP